MQAEFSWKKFQFIIEVQTALIANVINISLEKDAESMRRDIFSATGTLINMDDAFYAAERIPEKLSAHEAAGQFVGYVSGTLELPHEHIDWFVRYC